jgi:hypothetical protein
MSSDDRLLQLVMELIPDPLTLKLHTFVYLNALKNTPMNAFCMFGQQGNLLHF